MSLRLVGVCVRLCGHDEHHTHRPRNNGSIIKAARAFDVAKLFTGEPGSFDNCQAKNYFDSNTISDDVSFK